MAVGKQYKRFAGASVNNAGYHNENWDRFFDGNAVHDVGFDSLAEAITYIGTASKTLYITTQHRVTSSRAIPSNISLVVLKGGSFAISAGVTLTIQGHFEAGWYTVFSGSGVVEFTKPPNLVSFWWGALGDDSTNDATAINAGIVCGNSSGGADLYLGPHAYFTGSTPIAMASNVRLIGAGIGNTVIRATDAGAYGALNYMVTFGAAVTNASIHGMTLSCSTMTTNGVTGIHVQGTRIKIYDVAASNIKIGILGAKTSQYVDIRNYRQSSTTATAGFGILCNGVQDWTIDGMESTGATTSIGIDKPCSFQNGGTAYGCQRVKITNFRSNYSVGYGLGGNPDDFHPDVTATFPNATPYWSIFFKAATGVIASDVGKVVVQGATTIGTLLAYDDTVLPARWVVSLNNTPAADTATTITSGTGSGTTLINNHRMKANATTDCQWTGVDSNYGLDTQIGHGVSMDACFSTHLSKFSCNYNSEAGVYIGDSLCMGSTVSNGTARYNDWGVVCAASAVTSISGVDIAYNELAGIYFIPIASGLSNVVNYTAVSGNQIYRNGRSGSSLVDSGIGGEPSYCVFTGNAIFENYRYNVGLSAGTDCRWFGNYIVDSGWTGGTVSNRECVRFEGATLRHLWEGNFIGSKLSPSTVTYCVNIVTNANDNIFRNNTMVGFITAAFNDAGLRNQDLDNWKSATATDILNGTGLTVRTTGATLNYPTATTNTTANPALTLENPTTSTITPTLKVSGNVNTNFGQEPFNRAADFLNKHADFSSDLVRIENDGVAGVVNAVNGALLGISGTLGAPLYRLSSVATNDDPEEKVAQGRVATTDATLTTIFSVALAASQTRAIEAIVIARRTGGTAGTAEDGARYKLSAVYKNVAGTATIIGAATVTADEDQAGWDAAFSVSGSSVLLRVTGAVDNNITFHATVRMYRVGT